MTKKSTTKSGTHTRQQPAESQRTEKVRDDRTNPVENREPRPGELKPEAEIPHKTGALEEETLDTDAPYNRTYGGRK